MRERSSFQLTTTAHADYGSYIHGLELNPFSISDFGWSCFAPVSSVRLCISTCDCTNHVLEVWGRYWVFLFDNQLKSKLWKKCRVDLRRPGPADADSDSAEKEERKKREMCCPACCNSSLISDSYFPFWLVWTSVVSLFVISQQSGCFMSCCSATLITFFFYSSPKSRPPAWPCFDACCALSAGWADAAAHTQSKNIIMFWIYFHSDCITWLEFVQKKATNNFHFVEIFPSLCIFKKNSFVFFCCLCALLCICC